MKEHSDYRKYFKEYYQIDFGDEYEIHHIDLNHFNNDIMNLMILPKSLHKKYHRLLSDLNVPDSINFLVNVVIHPYIVRDVDEISVILGEMINWSYFHKDLISIPSYVREEVYRYPEGIIPLKKEGVM